MGVACFAALLVALLLAAASPIAAETRAAPAPPPVAPEAWRTWFPFVPKDNSSRVTYGDPVAYSIDRPTSGPGAAAGIPNGTCVVSVFVIATDQARDFHAMAAARRAAKRRAFASMAQPGEVRGDVRVCTVRCGDGGVVWCAAVRGPVPDYSGWVTVGRCGRGAAEEQCLFAGTAFGVVALSTVSGAQRWEHTAYATAQVAPAHPTYASGRVWFTMENGVKSGGVVSLFAADGRVAFPAPDAGFTLVWYVKAADAVAYCGYYPPGVTNIHAVARPARATYDDVPKSLRLWEHGNLTYTPPGLWDNPNFDVDAEGRTVFMYAKPTLAVRSITAFDGTTGAVLWSHPETMDPLDYDTYAYDGDFFRLYSANGTDPHGRYFILERTHGRTGVRMWRRTQYNPDGSTILAMGSDLAVSTELARGELVAYSSLDGSGPLWRAVAPVPTTATFDVTGRLMVFGSGDGYFHAVHAHCLRLPCPI